MRRAIFYTRMARRMPYKQKALGSLKILAAKNKILAAKKKILAAEKKILAARVFGPKMGAFAESHIFLPIT